MNGTEDGEDPDAPDVDDSTAQSDEGGLDDRDAEPPITEDIPSGDEAIDPDLGPGMTWLTEIQEQDRWTWEPTREITPSDPPTPAAIREAVVAESLDVFEGDDDTTPVLDQPTRDALETEFFDFRYLEADEQVERYWLHPPYAYASIRYDEESGANYYRVVEPVLSRTERHILEDLKPIVKDELARSVPVGGVWDSFRSEVLAVVADYGAVASAATRHKLAYYLMREFQGYGEIDALVRDDRLEDISADGSDVPVFVYHERYANLPTTIRLTGRELDGMVRRLAHRAGEMVTYADPIVSGSLPEKHRVQLTMGSDVGPRGSNFTMRLFKAIPFTPVDLIGRNTFSVRQMAFLWLCVEHGKSIVFVGPTASGKTTTMNAVLLFMDPYAKIVTIEQTRELAVPHDNWIAGVTRSNGKGETGAEIDMNDLLGAALHQRPDYLLIGEIRTDPTVLTTFLQSIFTGHAGSTTFHARDVDELINRLNGDPFNLADHLIAELDLIVVQRQLEVDERRQRRCIRIAEPFMDYLEDEAEVRTEDIFRYDAETDYHAAFDPSATRIVEEIREDEGWSRERVEAELERRRQVLQYFMTADVTDYRDIWATISAYAQSPEELLEEIDAGTFDPSSVAVSFDEPGREPPQTIQDGVDDRDDAA